LAPAVCVERLEGDAGLKHDPENHALGLRPDGWAREYCAPEPGRILLCMGLFSRFCVQAPRCTAEEALESVQRQPFML
jgi:hypothetical protein